MSLNDGTNVVDLPCVPVTHLDGRQDLLSLRDCLLSAHTVAGLGTRLLPVEREALLRLLESLTAAVLAGADPDDVADDALIPQERVDAFFEKHRRLFDVADPDRPLMQEWHVGAVAEQDERFYRPIDEMHLRVVGKNSATWGVTPETRDASAPDVLFLLLAVSWFHGKSSNAGGASFYRATSGSKRLCVAGAPAGGPHDTVFHLMGPTLAESLLMNIPRRWLLSADLPAWLDQDHCPSPDAYSVPGTLWRTTWTPNRAHVRWREGAAVAFTRGLTARMIPEVGEAAGVEKEAERWKINAKAVTSGDYARIRKTDPKKPEKSDPVHASPTLRSAEGFERWYRADLGRAVGAWIEQRDAVLPPEGHPRLAFHHEEGDTYGNRELSTWTEIPLTEVTLSGESAMTAAVLTDHVGTIGKAAHTAAAAASSPRSKLVNDVRAHVYSALDAPVLQAFSRLADGCEVDVDRVRRVMTDVSIRAFVEATEPLRNAASAPAVYRARQLFAGRVKVKETA